MTHFFTYGNEKYRYSKNRIEKEANDSGFFDKISIFGREDINKEFFDKTLPHIGYDRGGGYWLWKAYFLKNVMDSLSEGDYCVYADAGCTINSRGKSRLEEYFKMIDSTGVLSFQLTHIEKKYTTEKIFQHFNVHKNSTIRETGQLIATILVFKKNSNSMKIVNEFYETALNAPEIFSDVYNFGDTNCDNDNSFIDNRHDQSVLSVIRKLNHTTEIPDETYSSTIQGWNYLSNFDKIPILATRIRY